MADKKETKRERREEAKRRRLEELRKRQQKARMRKIYTFAIVGLVVAGIIVGVLAASGDSGDEKESKRLATLAGCDPVQNPKVLKNDHINPPARARYGENPPASGAHYNLGVPNGPTTSGIHRAFVPYEASVHNLEHGHVVIHYKEEIPQAIANELATVVREDPQWVALIPNPDMPFKVAFTAWGHLQGCDDPKDAIDDAARHFIKRFKSKAPETMAGTPEPGTESAVPPAGASPTATATPTSNPSPSPTPTATST